MAMSRPLKGILLSCSAVVLFSSLDSLSKYLSGFHSVLIVVRPGGGLLGPAMLLPLGSASGYACYQLLTRRIGSRDSAAATNLITGLVGTLGMSLLLPWFWIGWPLLPHLLAMAYLGLIALVGHLLLTLAFQYSSPVLLAPFSYLQILVSVLYGGLLFDHAPDGGALLGMAVIALGGLGSAWLQARGSR